MVAQQYLIYKRQMINGRGEEWITAVVDGDIVYGETPRIAEGIRAELKERGWPATKSPEDIFYGMYFWAAGVTQAELNRRQLPPWYPGPPIDKK